MVQTEKSGTCGISFTVDNMNSSRYASLYRFQRTNNTTISNNWDEISLKFNKDDKTVNGNMKLVYFEIEITDDEVSAEYEYCIGFSKTIASADRSKNDAARFFWLYLAGTDEHSGPSEGMAALKCLDYVYKLNGQYLPSFTDESYRPNHLKLIFDFYAESDDTFILYNMDDIQNSQFVYYYAQGVTVVDMIHTGSVGNLQSTTAKFPPRIETS